MMRDCTVMCNRSGEEVATIGFDEACGLWQIVVLQREEIAMDATTAQALWKKSEELVGESF
jgi:hypothetical protein